MIGQPQGFECPQIQWTWDRSIVISIPLVRKLLVGHINQNIPSSSVRNRASCYSHLEISACNSVKLSHGIQSYLISLMPTFLILFHTLMLAGGQKEILVNIGIQQDSISSQAFCLYLEVMFVYTSDVCYNLHRTLKCATLRL